MRTYGFYSLNDPNKEWIGKVEAGSLEDAIYYFSQRKALKVVWFMEVYNVEEIRDETER